MRASGTVPTARLTIGSSLRALLLALVVGSAVLGTRPGPAAAQEGTDGDVVESYQDCRDRTLDGGGDELDAARRCVPDPDALRRCLGGGRISSAEIEACVREQLLDRTVTEEPGAATTSEPPVTTSSSSSIAPAPPGGGGGGLPIDLPEGVADDRGGDDGGDGGLGLPVVIGIAGAALVAGVVVGRAMRRPTAPFPEAPAPVPAAPAPAAIPAPAPLSVQPEPTPDPAPGPDVGASRHEEERAALVAALIELADEARSDAVRGQIVRQLASVGVEPVVVAPDDRFDPTAHRGIHAEPATGPEQADTVAAMERPGWLDRGRVLRPPEVVVRRWDGGPS